MHARAWLPALALLALAPLAAAAYGPGSELAAERVTLDGRVDSTFPRGVASFLGSGAAQPFVVLLAADELHVSDTTVAASCAGFSLPGAPSSCAPGTKPETTEHLLRDARVTVTKILSPYKVVVTTDRAYADTSTFGETGRLLATSGVTTTLASNAEPMRLSGAMSAWSASEEPRFLPVYEAEARSSEVASTNALVRALGGFETFLQGFEIRVTGTGADGKPFSQTFDTRVPSDARDSYRFLVVEAKDGDLTASGSAPFAAYAPASQAPASDVHDRATFARATGELAEGRTTRTYADEEARLAGPLHLRLVRVEEGATPRVVYTVQSGLLLAGLPEDADKEPLPPGALAAAGAAGAGGAGLLLALAYLWPRLKYALTLMVLPLYTRIERDAVLEHEKRDELYELIRSAPGIHAHEIGEKANIGWGTTVYHLKLLENHGLIVSKKSGRYKRFFVNTGEYTKKKDVYGALRNETAKSVAQYIVDHPGTTQKEMCAALGIQPSLASWHVEKLEGVELVKRVKDGRMVRYFAGPAWGDLNVRVNPLAGGADTPVET